MVNKFAVVLITVLFIAGCDCNNQPVQEPEIIYQGE